MIEQMNDALAKRVEELKHTQAEAQRAREFLMGQERAAIVLEGAIKQLQELGATHPEVSPLPTHPEASKAEEEQPLTN